jgi:hypothetical protein
MESDSIDYIPPGKAPKPKRVRAPLEKYKDIKWYDKARRSLSNIERSAPEAGKKIRAFVDEWDANKARWIEDFRTLRKVVKDNADMDAEKIVRYLDEWDTAKAKALKLSPDELGVARQYQAVLSRIADEAEASKILVGRRSKYFPHRFAGPGRYKQAKVDRPRGPGGGRVDPNLEIPRKKDPTRKDWIKSLDILDNYADDVSRRIAEANNLGRKHEKLARAYAKYKDMSPDQVKFHKKAIAQITRSGAIREAAGPIETTIRTATAWLDLMNAAIYQPGQMTATMVKGGFRNSVVALSKIITDPAFRKTISKGARRSGATLPDVVQELAGNLKGTNKATRTWNKYMKGKMWGIPTLDKAMRYHAYAVGDVLLKQADQGKLGARKLLDQLGFEKIETRMLQPEMVGRKLSDVTQFRMGAAEKPLWATNTMAGRFAYQYGHFAYQWGILVRDIYKTQSFTGIAKLMIAGGLAGEIVGNLRALSKGFGFEDLIDDKELREIPLDDPDGYLRAFTTRTRRFPLDHPIHRALQNFAMVGGLGVFFERFAEMALRPSEWSDIGTVFPAARRPAAILEGITEAAREGDVEPLLETGKDILPGGLGYSGWAEMLGEENARVGGRRKSGSRSRVGGRR